MYQCALFTLIEDKYNSIQTNGSPYDSDQDDRPGTGMIYVFRENYQQEIKIKISLK